MYFYFCTINLLNNDYIHQILKERNITYEKSNINKFDFLFFIYFALLNTIIC